ncbi:hypothetical protein [Mucilaginibacter flavus]|uniref:hypothetical protein n=1 Tax=Mucilaginibacter flavus TaxID=931504 RepID=UPI0025B29EE7|nr:hypothetical protein [Mucilaginibacter flavus]MDN3584563.1 hypothetical protein [Mucilaginibacter flavus]
MEKSQPKKKQLDFGSMTEIMERFYQVPFEQFQQELDDWFTKALLEKGLDLQKIQDHGKSNLSSLPDLIGKIYHHAELLKTLSETQIKKSDESK